MRTRNSRRRRGQSLAELALCLPLLLAVTALVIEGTLLISTRHALVDAVHQATRVASKDGSGERKVRRRVLTLISGSPLVDPYAVSVQVRRGIDSNGSDNVSVTAVLPVRPFTFARVGTFTLRASATYRIPTPLDGPSA